MTRETCGAAAIFSLVLTGVGPPGTATENFNLFRWKCITERDTRSS